jgi:hypothetical protein
MLKQAKSIRPLIGTAISGALISNCGFGGAPDAMYRNYLPSSLHRQGASLLTTIHELRQVEAIEPPLAFTDFCDTWVNPETPDGLWQRYNLQIGMHTQAWQAVLTQCGVLPGSPQNLH